MQSAYTIIIIMESVVPQTNVEGFWGHLSEIQIKALALFKQQLLILKTLYPQAVEQYSNDDILCLQFLRARKFHIDNTIAMFVKYCNWRNDNHIDQIFAFRFPEVIEVRKYYPRGYHRTDRIVHI